MNNHELESILSLEYGESIKLFIKREDNQLISESHLLLLLFAYFISFLVTFKKKNKKIYLFKM
jgi:hypothetical protein